MKTALDELKAQFEGSMKPNQALSKLSWLRTGGEADWFFQAKDHDDLGRFLNECPDNVSLYPMGVGSNTIFRDGGFEGVVVKMGRAFMEVDFRDNGEIYVGAAMLDGMFARKAADHGHDLTFLRTIPGAIGGAVAMNAGCYGSYMADVLVAVDVIHRNGSREMINAKDILFEYRNAHLPDGAVIVGALLAAENGDPERLHNHMNAQLAKREETQPVKELTCGSTFRNPVGHSSTGEVNEDHSLKAWKVIDDAGLRGEKFGGAQMSPMHPNFLVNTGDATSFDLESLGEKVRSVVKAKFDIELTWEIKLIGRFLQTQRPDWEY